MQIRNIFSKDLFRAINGVVKAHQLDDASVWQELDEYVVTRELDKHFRRFFEVYLSAINNPGDPSIGGRMGVWVSGFFGSGKSHFIKILSYLLKNRKVCDPSTTKEAKAVDLLAPKIGDAMLLADIKRAIGADTDVILFNIDSKADAKDGRGAILSVFMRVFNEMQGFCGDAPHIADLERYLCDKGKYDSFCQTFSELSGSDWHKERDAYLLMRDEVVETLSKTLGMTQESAQEWFDKAEANSTLSIEGFAKCVKEYLDRKGPNHGIVFLVDEVGQFIGSDGHLMLSLQTITEDLGRICGGRAWVIVTSQEDIDAVLGDLKAAKANDFSKIQGRFATRLSLSSSNTDEVIQSRLLEKDGAASAALERLFSEKGDILKHQLSFTNDSANLKQYKDEKDFAANYPFAPYHFQLLQKIFESIRKAGATGLHLSRGERSMLDAFQSAAKNISGKDIGALVPLYEFYPAIESFLDTAVKRTVDQAKENSKLEQPFDVQLLQTLFLIRYVDIIKPNIDNLVTLCIEEVDADRISIKRKIEESLLRLEKETLINRNGDLYFFLTNEEREVSSEIKGMDISSGEEAKRLCELIYDEVLKQQTKYRYKPNRRDYGFNRFCDGYPHGAKVDQELSIEVISPLNDEYSFYIPGKCVMRSAEDGGRIIVKLSEASDSGKDLARELGMYLRTQKYIKLKSDTAASGVRQTILRDRAEENRTRNERLVKLVEKLILEADFYAIGQTLTLKAANAPAMVEAALDYLIKNIYTKFSYLTSLHDDPQKEIKALLLSDDVCLQQLKISDQEANPNAMKELRQFIELMVAKNHRIALDELAERFTAKPYGWPEWEIILLVAKLFALGEVKLMVDGAAIQLKEAIDPLTKSVKWKQVTILRRKVAGKEDLEKARKLGQKLFGKIGPDNQDGLSSALAAELREWRKQLLSFKPLADTGGYPGKNEIDEGLKQIQTLVSINDPYEFIKEFNKNGNDLQDLADDIHELMDFYKNLKPTWERLRAAKSSFKPNRSLLYKDPAANQALSRMDIILEAQSPYGMLKEVDSLIATVKSVNDGLVEERKKSSQEMVDGRIAQISQELDAQNAVAELRNKALKPLQDIKKRIQDETSIPNIALIMEDLDDLVEEALDLITKSVPPPKEDEVGVEKVKPAPKPIQNIKVASLTAKLYLDTEGDVDEYVGNLREKLIGVIKTNSRIRIM